MNNWDAIFGEVALGLEPARVDLVPNEAGQEPGRAVSAPVSRSGPRARAQVRESDAPGPAGPGTRSPRADRPSLRLSSRSPAPTSDLNAIFRQEALEFRARGRDASGAVVRLGTRWIQWGYRITLLLLVAAVAGMWLIRTDESTSGPAVVDGRTGQVAALLPAVVGPDLASSQTFALALPGGRYVQVSGLQAQLADSAVVRKAGLVPSAQPAILVTGLIDRRASAELAAQAAHWRTQMSVVLRSESLADVLARQFNAMLGRVTTP